MRYLLTFFMMITAIFSASSQDLAYPFGKVVLKDGFRYYGTFREIGPDLVVLQTESGKTIRISNNQIRKIVLDKKAQSVDNPAGYEVRFLDGTLLNGLLLAKDQPEIRLVSQSGDDFTLNLEEVRSIKRLEHGSRTTHQEAGGRFFHWMEMGGLFGKSQGESAAAFSVHTINGYRLGKFLQPGLGVGFDFYDDFTAVPIYFSLSADLIKARVIPYYYGGAGYGIAWQNSNSPVSYDRSTGGFTWSAGLGVKIPLAKIAMTVSAGFKEQRISTTTGDLEMGFETIQERKLRRFDLATGITF